jgi:hypothetical protein
MSNGVPYRRIAESVIRRILDDHPGEPIDSIRKKIRAAYPFGYPSPHPVRVWNEVVSRQLTEWKKYRNVRKKMIINL